MAPNAICRDATAGARWRTASLPHARAYRRPILRVFAQQEQTMLDILMLALAAGCFAFAIGYTYVCERL